MLEAIDPAVGVALINTAVRGGFSGALSCADKFCAD